MYVKLYPSLWDGSMASDSFDLWALWVFLLAHADVDGFIEMTPEVISRRSGIPPDLVTAGLARLEAPDPRSRSRDHDGRRLEPIDDRGWGWRVVNYTAYRNLKDDDQRRRQNREAQARRRDRLRQQASAGVSGPSATVSSRQQASAHTEADADAQESTHLSPDWDVRANGKPREAEPIGFHGFYMAYPRHDGRRAAALEFRRALKRHPDYTAADLQAAASQFRRQVESEGREPRFIPMPKVWLSQDRYREFFDEADDAKAQDASA